MNRIARQKRKLKVRGKIAGDQKRPRLNVFRSSKYIYSSLIDDFGGKTLLWVSDKNIKGKEKATKSDKAFLVGKELANKALKKGYKKVVFDRAGYLYHGRIKKVAEGAREEGLEF